MTDRLDAHPHTGPPKGPDVPAAAGARLRDALRSIGLQAGLDAVGVAAAEAFPDVARTLEQRRADGLHGGMQFTYRNPARSTDPQRILAGARSLVVGARRYLRQSPDDPSCGTGPSTGGAPATARTAAAEAAPAAGRIARYSWVDHYAPLREALAAMAAHLQEAGWRAVVVADDNALVDRAAAHRAGLGWYGKNTTLLLPGAGSWFVLGSVVTDAPLPVAGQPVADGCGTCRRCQAACPTGALDTAGVLDARRCLAWLVQAPGIFPVEHRVALGDRFYGCDDCQEACPVNRLGARRQPPAPAEPDARPGADLLAVLGATDEELMAEWGRWYIPGRDPAVLRRNALLVLANIADPDDPAVAAAMDAALRHPSPLVRAHAVWAARRLGRPDLLGAVGRDPDPTVRAEADPSRVVPRRAGPGGPPLPSGAYRPARERLAGHPRRTDTKAAAAHIMRHLLVTNDFPPKIGGIQSYLWELWRRLPAEDVTVLTTPYRDDDVFDRGQAFRIERTREPVLLPNPLLRRHIRRLAAEVGAGAVVLDPGLPLGAIGPGLGLPYAVVLHGAEVAVPGRLPATRQMLRRVVQGASLLVTAGGYPEAEARRAADGNVPPVVHVPPGVDTRRFVPLAAIDRVAARSRLGLPTTGPLVVSVSRLVPRKGMDTLIEAAALLAPDHPGLTVAIAGAGRDHGRLEQLARRRSAPVRFLGRVPDLDLPDLYACGDVFALCCRSRWRGLEQEGFGIVFLEAAAAGVASVAGQSGGAAEAVADGETGTVVDDPADPGQVAAALDRLLGDPALASRWGQAARRRAERDFDYDTLAATLGQALDAMGAALGR